MPHSCLHQAGSAAIFQLSEWLRDVNLAWVTAPWQQSLATGQGHSWALIGGRSAPKARYAPGLAKAPPQQIDAEVLRDATKCQGSHGLCQVSRDRKSVV